MKKFFFGITVFLFFGLLSGCNELLKFSITEQEVNQALQNRPHFQKQLKVAGLADAKIELYDLTSKIGREEPNKVVLTGTAKIYITSLFGPQSAEMKLAMKTQPVFEPKQGAIFLKELQINDVQVKPEKMQSLMQTLTPYLNQSLKDYFDQHPAYVLNADRSKTESLAKKFAKGLEVKPGKLVIPLV